MKALNLHPWKVSPQEAQEIQKKLASKVSQSWPGGEVQRVAGVDISSPSPRGLARGAVVVLSFPELSLEEQAVVEDTPFFPYIPGLLSFRESPVLLKALERLSTAPDLLLVDGQGLAHPRRFGIACHLGLLYNLPTIGCAKSILCGSHSLLEDEAGAWKPLIDNGEVVGAAVRTKTGVAPVYVSIGHRIDLEKAISWVVACTKDQRLPEPLRLAHLAAGGQLGVKKKKSELPQPHLSL